MGPVQEPVRSGMAEAAPRPCGDAAEPDGAEAVQPQTSTAAISAMNASMVFIRQNLCRRQDKGLDEGTLKHRVGLPCEGGPKAFDPPGSRIHGPAPHHLIQSGLNLASDCPLSLPKEARIGLRFKISPNRP